MKKHILYILLSFFTFFFLNLNLFGQQQVPIVNYSTDANGQVLLEVNSTTQNYYILKIRHDSTGTFDIATSMTLGEAGSTIITEPLGSYPLSHYQVLEYQIASPADVDGDGIDDLTEYQNIPTQSPINAAPSIDPAKGLVYTDSFTTFKQLSVTKDVVQWSEFLNGKGFVKYIITDFFTSPKVYFINSARFVLHKDFAASIGIEYLGDDIKKGQVIYHPATISNNGTLGTFAFNYSNGYPQDSDIVQRTHELLAANMPFIQNNLAYFITEKNEAQYYDDKSFYDASRVSILLEADVYADVDYWGLNPAEGYGFFRKVNLGEIPGPKDIVLYDVLPNALPRVGGIITSVFQTPLSHVNLRAIQNKVPNAFIRDPLLIDSVSNLLDKYIYFKVEQDDYVIREATLEEVNAWFEDIRPDEEQSPPLNLNYTDILPLEDISFSMFDGFGAKCANIATMQTFGFPDNTIPDGFGVPFYFYQEFMKHNGFFDEVQTMLDDPNFQSDRTTRDNMLKDFRKKIKNASMPTWMTDELTTLQQSFPTGTSIRCRSSTNNEDLPGFNGAGLYDSKTQHPHEGHISKSIKQVYASLWNLRAYEERDFYRVNHFVTSMGVLCHPNYSDEKVNGVGVSTDPIYNTDNTFYLNSQIGEDLITNPNGYSIPEEILLDRVRISNNDYIMIQRSNLISNDSLVLEEHYLDQMRDFLSVIHDEFEELYGAEGNPNFAMDIEYKVTKDDQLIIKQARPWVAYILEEPEEVDSSQIDLKLFPNPAHDYIVVQCDYCNLSRIRITDIVGRPIYERALETTENLKFDLFINNLHPGIYIMSGFTDGDKPVYSRKFVKW